MSVGLQDAGEKPVVVSEERPLRLWCGWLGGVLNSYPSSQPLGRLAEISLKWLLLRPYDKGEEARYAAVARASTHIGHLQRRVRENIDALTLVQDHGRLSGGS